MTASEPQARVSFIGSWRRTGFIPVLFFLSLATQAAVAQVTVRSWLPWRTLETPGFVFHYPLELEAWTRDVAGRMGAIDSAVTRIVGYRLRRTTHVVVDDPYTTANGSAWPYVDQPIMNFWATPPDPREDIGSYRVWGEMLATHEFAHIVHLARPSRNSIVRRLWSALPANLGPVTRKTPRWAFEGYATLVEGRVTGSGRPHGTWRAAFLRQWALEGALPTYQQLDNWGAFAGGEFTYLAGSAYLEWLTERAGDSSLVHVWRRLSARTTRTFDAAFIGIFGETPSALYRRFTAELTAKAVSASAAALDSGVIVQRLAWGTGDPAISPNGDRVAVVIRSATQPPRLVIWRTADEPDTMRARRDSALLARDPEDVPARRIYPPPKRALATLRAVGASGYQGPRFLNDGRVLVWRYTLPGDGTLVPDLFIWNPTARSVQRITRGARVKNGDPSPDGRTAVAERCRGGHCDLVRVDLRTGAVTTMQSGDARRSFYRPRWSRDGSRVVVSVHDGGRWRLQVTDVATGTSRFVDPDDGASRFDAAFASPTTVVCVSDASGTPNIELLDLESGRTRTLTAVTGAAVAPEPHPTDGSIWFLSLYSRGFDVRRVSASSRQGAERRALSDSLAPATPVAAGSSLLPLESSQVSPPRPYTLGTRLFRWIPAPQWSADGRSALLALTSSDIIGRSELLAEFAAGDGAMWRGASISATWRGTRAPIRLSVFDAAQRPSLSRSWVDASSALDARLTGAALALDMSRALEQRQSRLRMVATTSRISHLGDSSALSAAGVPSNGGRHLAAVDLTSTWHRRRGPIRLSGGLATNVAYGTSGEQPLRRIIGRASAGVVLGTLVGVTTSAMLGDVNATADPFEQFTVGGPVSPLVDDALLGQRIVMPALPTGIRGGRSVLAYRVSIPLVPLSPFLWAASTTRVDGHFEDWQRVIGAERSINVPHIALAGTPAARALFGAGYSLDDPFAKKLRAYVALIFP